MHLRALALLAVAAFALAGCASEPPAGTLKTLDYRMPVAGSAAVFYQPFTGANPSGGVPTAGQQTQCAQNQVPDPTGMVPIQRCKGPYTTFAGQVTLPPLPEGSSYKLYAVGPGFEYEAFTFQGKEGSYSGSANATDKDYSAQVKELQVRMDGVPLATAPGTAGNHTLALAPALAALTVTGTFTGRHLEVTIAGLPANGTYMARLYVPDPASMTGFTAKEMFQVKDGTTAFDSAERDIADYAEFHIHVGNSMVNLYKAALEAPAE